MKDETNFKFYFPADLEKASKDAKGNEVMKFKGIASTSSKDSQNETLDPSTFDLRETLWVNWNHAGSTDPGTIIGETTKTVLTPKKELYVEGFLYPEVTKAKDTYTLMKALKNSPSGNKLGISVEGKVIERGCGPEFLDKDQKVPNPDFTSAKWNKIVKARITGMALCPVPINGDTWADITKGQISENLQEEYDEDTKAALSTVNNGLTKGQIFEKIYEKFPGIDTTQAKSLFSLIEKTTSAMNTEENKNKVSEETISKAFEILNLATAEVAKDETSTTIEKSDSTTAAAADEDDEMVEKAHTIVKAMTAEKKEAEFIKKALINKGYGEKVIEKAMSKKDPTFVPNDAVSKSEVGEIVKSHLNEMATAFDTKFNALGVLLKSSYEENLEIKKSLADSLSTNKEMQAQLDAIAKTSPGAKSLISKGFNERFDTAAEGAAKGGYSLSNPQDRIALRDKLTELSGINKGERYDERLTNIAQELEITKSMSQGSANLLKAMDIVVLA